MEYYLTHFNNQYSPLPEYKFWNLTSNSAYKLHV